MPSWASVAEPLKAIRSPTAQARFESGAVIVGTGGVFPAEIGKSVGGRGSVGIGDLQADLVHARRGVGEARRRRGRVPVLPVPVEIPGVGEAVTRVGIGGRRSRRSAPSRGGCPKWGRPWPRRSASGFRPHS